MEIQIQIIYVFMPITRKMTNQRDDAVHYYQLQYQTTPNILNAEGLGITHRTTNTYRNISQSKTLS